MKKIHLINPCAGYGKATKILDKLRESGTTDEVYVPKSAADFSAYIAKRTAEEPNVHFQVYGGDGTVYDTVNGIISTKHKTTTVKSDNIFFIFSPYLAVILPLPSILALI